MAATKIINVVKDDTFDEVFDLFKDTAAEEVIFILPKRTKVLSRQEQFEQIQVQAQQQGKKVSLLSANPDTIALARQYDFEILQEKAATPRPARKTAKVKIVTAVKKEEEEDTDESDNELIPDNTEAFDPHSTSDYTSGIIESEEAGHGRDIDNEEALEDDAVGDEANIASDEGLEESAVDEPEEIEDIADKNIDPAKADIEDEIDESAYQPEGEPALDDEEEDQEDAGVARAPVAPVGISIRAARAKKLDGLVVHTADARNVQVRSAGNKPVSLNVKRQPVAPETPHTDMEQIAEVWQHEPFQKGETVWSEPVRPQRPGLFSRLFKRNRTTEQPDVKLIHQPKLPRSRRRMITIGLAVAVLAAGVVYVKAGSAKIMITPFSKKLDFEMTANASDQFSAVDPTFNKLPGQLFSIEKSVTQEFTATGQREVAQKAKGTITVYNTHSNAIQTLIATTRFESANGLVFRTLRTVTVPGMVNDSTPGKIDVEVVADKPGSTYNIAPGRFTIAAFKEKGDTARYQKFYGQSTAAMQGGASGLANVVTEEDFTKAKEMVLAQLKHDIQEALTGQASGLTIANSDAITVTDTEASTQPDQAADKFTITMKGMLKTVGYKPGDLETLVKEYTIKNYGVTIVPEQIHIETRNSRLDEAKGILEITTHITGNGYGQVQTTQIINDLAGKGEADIVGYLKQADGVAEAKVLLSPFWVKKVPKNKEKVQVQVNYQ